MSPINKWAPPTWILFHTLAFKLKESEYKTLGPVLFNFITQVCHNLPCPTCAEHAKSYINRLMKDTSFMTNKKIFINALYIFHNDVNERIKKPMFNYEDLLKMYQGKNLIHVYNNFVQNFHSGGTLTLINQNFHKKRILSAFKTWILANIRSFGIL